MEREGRAGQTLWMPAEKHLPEDPSDRTFELVPVGESQGPAGKE
jgi:hypothetical protein